MGSGSNNDRDADAIAEAATRPTMRSILVKSESQSDILSLHLTRGRLVVMRTALINHLRTLLFERGIVFPQSRRKLEATLARWLIKSLVRSEVCLISAHETPRRLTMIPVRHGADGGLASSDTKADDGWRRALLARDQQTREPISPQKPDPDP